MGVLNNIRKAEREGARLVNGIIGVSGSGKTHTALQLAFGLANYDAEKIGFIDTENRRGSLYADALRNDRGDVQRFLIADLDPPFSPLRYRDAILEFQDVGVSVLIIDSLSHSWSGIGGCHDIAKPPGHGNKPGKWNIAKEQNKAMMNVLLQCDMHVIVCIRAHEEVLMRQGSDGKTEYVPQGLQPICEKNLPYELTTSIMMHDEGKSQTVLKCPAELRPVLGRQQGYITAEDGKALRDWVDGAKALNPAIERARNMLRTTTEQGMTALQAAWVSLPVAVRAAISADGKCPSDLKASAQEFDRQRAEAIGVSPDLDQMNAAIAGVSADADGVIQEEAA
jgi:hypothetical protein